MKDMKGKRRKGKGGKIAVWGFAVLVLAGSLLNAIASSANPLSVPYIRQVGDTDENFNGYCACGATSAVMITGYYSRLPSHPITCTYCSPSHTTNFGYYVAPYRQDTVPHTPISYSLYGFTFDIGFTGTSPCQINAAYGAYGYIHFNNNFAKPAYARNYFWKHGLFSKVDSTNPTETDVKNEIDKGHPVWASTDFWDGHIVVIKGYTSSNYIVADPWPDSSTTNYDPRGCADGSNMSYTWNQMGVGSKWIVTTDPANIADRVKVTPSGGGIHVRNGPGVAYPDVTTQRNAGDTGVIVDGSLYGPFWNSDDATRTDYHTWVKVQWDKDGGIGWSGIGEDCGSRHGCADTDNSSLWIEKILTPSCAYSVGQGTSGTELTAFQNAHTNAGGQSVLGCPTNTVQTNGFTSFKGTTGHCQNFENGTIEYHTNGNYAGQAFPIINPLYNKWASFGFSNNPLGYPISNLSSQSASCYGTSLKYQLFEGGEITYHLSGTRAGSAYEVHGAIWTKWGQKGYAGCPLGLPVNDERVPQPSGATGKTGKVSDFEGGHIHWWTNAPEAFETHGDIDTLYGSMGGTASWLGFPISDQYIAGTGYPRSDFEGGYITTPNGINYYAYSYSAGSLQFSSATYSVNENGGSILITVTRTNGSNGAVGVSYGTSNGTATAGSDYTSTSRTLSWATGDTANKTFSVPILDDSTYEPNETVNLTLSSATGGATLGSPSTAVLTIIDNDPAPAGTLQFSSATYSVNENGGSILITVTRTNGSNGAVGVSYGTSNGTATAGSDYTSTSGTLSWGNGDTSNKTFSIPILDDSTYEPNETVNLTLSSATGGATLGSPSTAVLTIIDNETPPAGTFTYTLNPNASFSYVLGNNQITSWQGNLDDGYYDLTLGDFDFQFYGTPVTNIRISTNGYITFGTDGTAFENVSIPNVNPPNALIAPFWDDLNLTGLGGETGVWWGISGTAPNRQLVIEWHQVPSLDYGTEAYSFEVILYESTDRIKFQYQDVDSGTSHDFGGSATVGIENFDGTRGVQYSFDGSSPLSNGKAIEFIPNNFPTGDFNNDGNTDILWRDKATGQDAIWLMNGVTLGNIAFLPTVNDLDWQIVGPK